jgi:hypothetical protein
MPKQVPVQIVVDVDQEVAIDSLPPGQLGPAMDPEVLRFQDWFLKQGNQPLTGIERSILKTYIGWKLLYEESSRDPQA